MENRPDTILKPLVDAIVTRRMVEPSIFFLEMSKPLVGCMRELYALCEPLWHSVLGSSLAPALKHALQSAADTERLIVELEIANRSMQSTTRCDAVKSRQDVSDL